METNFYIGALLLIGGTLYGLLTIISHKKKENILLKVDEIYTWGIIFCLIISGIIMIVKNV